MTTPHQPAPLADGLDRRAYFRTLPSYGPDWDAAIELGINVMQLEANLERSMLERLEAASHGAEFMVFCESIAHQLYGQK
jgi:hypothetical protein